MRDFKIYIAIASVVLVVYFVAQYNKPAPVNWQATLYYEDKIPFGTYILHNELGHFFPGAKVTNTNQSLYDQFGKTDITGSNYLILSKTASLSKYDFKAMVHYMELGNSVLITALEWSGNLADTLKLSIGHEFAKKNAGLNFTNASVKTQADYQFDNDLSSAYFTSFDTAHAVVLGKNEMGHSNFIRFKYGKGNLYLCTNPLIFTNYGLLTNRGDDYAAKVFSYLPPSQNLFWDEYQNGDIPIDPSPMRVFFAHPSLQWAYYIGLLSMILFVLYQSKRRQRIIPLVEPLKNSTVEFAQVVGQVYYEQRNNINIAEKKILFFLEHLRTKYHLKTNAMNAEFSSRLSQKTGIEHSLARQITGHISYVSAQKQINDDELIKLNQLIEQFYNKSR
jgi:hypothetical protein